MSKNKKTLSVPRRRFLAAGATAAVVGPAALLQSINNGAKAQGDPIPVGQA